MKKPLFPLQHEPFIGNTYSEPGSDNSAKVRSETIDNPDLRRLHEFSCNHPIKDTLVWAEKNKATFAPTTASVDLDIVDDTLLKQRYDKSNVEFFFVKRPLNTIIYLDEFLCQASDILPNGGYIACHCRTALLKKQSIKTHYPKGLSSIIYCLHYLWHRVCPKLWVTKDFYFAVTKGRNRTFNRVEVLGRLYRAGFEVISEAFRFGEFCVIGRKVAPPRRNDTPSGSPIIRLQRVGKDGKMIYVYKFRTMYSYSEYIQPYIYNYNRLQEGGKFRDDYRINAWGKLLRATWLDELPMLINLLKGEVKLVGVRPLSAHYLSLYSPEMQRLHTSVKPGLMPPFYYDKVSPSSIEDVQESERCYITAYHKHPLRTDCRYFWGIVKNIIFLRKKSH